MAKKKETYLLPQDVTDAEIAFGGGTDRLLPAYKDIPEEFKDWNSRNKWNKLFNDWFFNGLKNANFVCREGVDKDKAMRHLKACMGSWAPKHEHKEAGCAYLMSQFFEDVTYETGK